MNHRDAAIALATSPLLLVLGTPGLIFASVIWALGLAWIVHCLWACLAGPR